ncbi:tRNA-dihydrouridine synthase family protein [Desulfogranum marinum]|uniref:tRNA-dihydrouridine synthase family protein n=1 Tax=Desulfogranum marinum TaxID=453220 RepID=UPI00196448D9|nr:tRNA-dihydrouridine synthase family protein [Desulfogranum marinum]MBM9512815.1 tRNA-dihydrouridine synthase family protein [Desulfogranum marinum]
MSTPAPNSPFIYMAPLRGITDALFRRVYTRHFSGVDAVLAPFIIPHPQAIQSKKLLKDIIPEANVSGLKLIPQLLNSSADDFLAVAARIHDLGYDEVNWNLGCPAPMVAKKKRGSGLLPYPDEIESLLEKVMPRLKPRLSIKMRLGYRDYEESMELLPRLNKYPLAEIIIHPRLGTQLYKGKASPEHFSSRMDHTRHTLVYNGDIVSLESFTELQEKLPGIDRWMIGRGLVADPLLPEKIKGIKIPEEQKQKRLTLFHDELYAAMKENLSGPGHLLGRMKQVWPYFIDSFPEKKKQLKKIIKASTETKYLEAVEAVISKE